MRHSVNARILKFASTSFASALALLCVACGGGGSPSTTTTPPQSPTITSVTVSCALNTVPVGQTNQCNATVQGTGSFNSGVNWSVSNVQGGSATVGSVASSGLYTAPAAVPTPYTVTISATSTEDATKSASASVIVAGTIASVTQTITASAGGTITLPDGSSVAIPAGILSEDQNVTLAEMSALPTQPPNQLIVGVGISLQLGFSDPIPPLLSKSHASNSSRLGKGKIALGQTTSPSLIFTINQQQSSPGLNGALGLTEIIDTTNTANYISTTYTARNQSSTLGVPSSWLTGFENSISSVLVSAVNTAYVVYQAELPPAVALPANKCWQASTSSWVGYSSCSNQINGQSVLLLAHGMMTCVENTFTPLAQGNKTYNVILGFDYDWTQGLIDNGTALATFLGQIAGQHPSSLDILAHSEGVPVSLYGAALYMQSRTAGQVAVSNFVSLAGPILGTPVMNDLFADSAIYADYNDPLASFDTCPASQTLHGLGLPALLQSPFVQDLQENSASLSNTILPAVRSGLANTRIFVAGGYSSGPLGAIYGDLGSPFLGQNDGIVGLDSALAFNSGFVVHPLPPFPLFHTALPGNSGVLTDVFDQVTRAVSPELTCDGSDISCAGTQDVQFNFAGTGFDPNATATLYQLDQTGDFIQLQTVAIDGSGAFNWNTSQCLQPAGIYSFFAFDQTLASNNLMQTVSSGNCSGGVIVTVSPTAVQVAASGAQQFTATVTGSTNTAVTWAVNAINGGNSTIGTISGTGRYNAPAVVRTQPRSRAPQPAKRIRVFPPPLV